VRFRSGRRRSTGDLLRAEKPPRLILPFALALSVTLGLASAAILLVIHEFARSEAQRSATRQAGVLASALMQREVHASDLEGVVSAERRQELDSLFVDHIVADGTLGIALVTRSGLVTYSSDHALIGTRVPVALPTEAADGTIVSRVATSGEAGSGDKTLETYAPVGPNVKSGSALIVQSFAPIERAARSAQLKIGVVLEGLLVALLLVFVPLLVRLTRRIKRQIERIHQDAYYDPVTSLPNRAHLSDRLGAALRRAEREERQLAVLVVDIDRLREINDTLGHDAGNQVLLATASRLVGAVGAERFVARLDGDEFAVVTEFATELDVDALCQEVAGAVEIPIAVGDVQVAIEPRIGTVRSPQDGSDGATLLKLGQVAAHTAKDWRVATLAYTPAVDPSDPEQLGLMAELRASAAKGEIRLHYQPKVDMATEAVVGFEALAYWAHPTRGLLPPGAFIPMAERTGAIRHLSNAVLSDAVAQLKRWESRPDLTVAVNVTAIDLLDVQLPRRLRALLGRHEVDPGRLCLEVTESAIMVDPERTQAVLERIVAVGARIAIDDFGTGHSSLAYLKMLPAAELKIDKSFVAGLTISRQDRMIVHATTRLAHELGLRVVAEGVETRETHDALCALGCDYAQGYLYDRPLSVEDATALVLSEAQRAA
jgi:diguanylate cyclase (GGDEF)-like protein